MLLVGVAIALVMSRQTLGPAIDDVAAPPTEVSRVAPAPPMTASPVPPAPRAVSRQDIVTPTPIPAATFVTSMPAEDTVAANELGRIPILMYHAFTASESHVDEWTVTFDQFRAQLDWLRDHDFVMVGLNSMIERDFGLPAGKKPVILTFDDASSRQFGLQQADDGGYAVRPDTAVGVLEDYRQVYPEFVGPAFFAVLPFNCFASEHDPSTCEERLTWLVEHGYEVGNHTMGHQNLTDVSIDRFKAEVVGPIQWLAERVEGPNNLSDVLVLPFGAYPASDTFRALLFDGFWLEGAYVVPSLVIEVGGGPALAPYHVDWQPNLSRYNTDPEGFWYWADQISAGEIEIFTSDGDPETVTIPAEWEDALNTDLVRQDGRRVVILE